MAHVLYVIGVPAGDPRDFTLRARRSLAEVGTVVACDLAWARQVLASLNLRPALAPAHEQEAIWNALDRGDVALLSGEDRPAPSGAALALLQAVLVRSIPVVAVPGPLLPVTALVVSGLPADSFCFLGQLPEQAPARRRLLDVVASEGRTLIATESPPRLAVTLADLYAALGDRPVVALAASEPQAGWIWRGTLAAAAEQGIPALLPRACVLVIGGATTEEVAWDEARLRAEVAACLERGLRPKEIGQHLSAGSGWSRRQIYRLAVEQSRPLTNDRKETS